MPRIATYLRARSPDGPNSATAQREAFSRWLAEHPEFTPASPFEDLDERAPSDPASRVAWSALLAAVEQSEVDGVLVTTVDRISRDQTQLVSVVLGLHRRGVEVWTTRDSRPLAGQFLEIAAMIEQALPRPARRG